MYASCGILTILNYHDNVLFPKKIGGPVSNQDKASRFYKAVVEKIVDESPAPPYAVARVKVLRDAVVFLLDMPAVWQGERLPAVGDCVLLFQVEKLGKEEAEKLHAGWRANEGHFSR